MTIKVNFTRALFVLTVDKLLGFTYIILWKWQQVSKLAITFPRGPWVVIILSILQTIQQKQ